MKNTLQIKEPLIFLAGSCFAAAFSIPVLLFWLNSGKTFSFFLVFVAPVLTLAFLIGEVWGAEILKPNFIQNSKHALIEGLKVAILTGLVSVPLCALFYAIDMCVTFRDQHQWLTVQFLKTFFAGLLWIGAAGFILFGWLFALLSASTGWILYKFKFIR